MFNVVQRFESNKEIHNFLCSVLIEAVTENYRQLMFEQLMFASKNRGKETPPLDPPLRANERVMSGLFASAISRVSARSKPEARIDRTETDPDDENEDSDKTKPGRVDFLAWYGGSTVAVELKVAGVNWFSSKLKPTGVSIRRWKKVVEQAKEATRALTEKGNERYPHPKSIGLFVWVARSVVAAKGDKDDQFTQGHLDKVVEISKAIGDQSKTDNPDFIATYEFPPEFRRFIRMKNGKANEQKQTISTPFVTFMAYVAD